MTGVALLAALLIGTSAATAQARPRLTVGVSDNGAAMFTNPWFRRAGVSTARDMVSWDVAVMRDRRPLAAVTHWLDAARAAHVTPMITFAADPGVAGRTAPSLPAYTRAIQAFVKRFPWVTTYTPWNEPDFIYRSLANNPRLAAGYFNALVRACRHCTIVAGDVYRPAWQGLAAWVRSYSHFLIARPAAWAMHPYDDVRSHTTSEIRAMLSVTRGPLWLTEISGVERRGHWHFGNQSPAGANHDERFLFSLPRRFPRITRIYHYQWQAVRGSSVFWDSGLLGESGKPRPAYWTFANAVRGRLP